MSEGLLAGYRGTRYAVLAGDDGTVAEARIDQHCPDVDAVLGIAVAFEQNAVVVVGRGAPARLVLSDVMTS
jgi:hypothetical protein